MVLKFLLAIVTVVASSSTSRGQAAPEPMTYLQCELDSFTKFKDVQNPLSKPVTTRVGYGFRSRPPGVVDAYSPKIELQNIAVTENTVEFTNTNRFDVHEILSRAEANFQMTDAASSLVLINRLTGSIRISFFPQHGPAEQAACRDRKNGGPWCDYPPLAATLTGRCKVVARRF